MNKIGQFIKKLRKEKGLTQSQLAEKLNISFQSVSKWETGETLPDTNILLSLCDELDVEEVIFHVENQEISTFSSKILD